MKLPFINEGIFKPYKSPVERGESSYIHNKDIYNFTSIIGGLGFES